MGDKLLVVEELGAAVSHLHHLGGGPEQLIRGIGVNPQADIGILEGELLLGAEDEVGQWIGGVPAVGGQAAQGKGLKVGVALVAARRALALVGNHLAHLDEHAFQNLHGPLLREGAVLQARLVEGIEILVQSAQTHAAAVHVLQPVAHLEEPLGLHRLIEVPGGVLGHMAADLRNGLQLGPAYRVALLRGHRLGPVRIAVGICNHGLAGENRGVQIVDLVHLVVQQVALDARLLLLQLADDALQALPDYLFIGAGPAQCVGVVGLVEDEALGGILLVAVDHPAGLPGEHVQIELMGGLALPVRNHLVENGIHLRLGHGVARLALRLEDLGQITRELAAPGLRI